MVPWILACAAAFPAHAAMEEICPAGSMCTNRPATALLQTISKQNAPNKSAEESTGIGDTQASQHTILAEEQTDKGSLVDAQESTVAGDTHASQHTILAEEQ